MLQFSLEELLKLIEAQIDTIGIYQQNEYTKGYKDGLYDLRDVLIKIDNLK